MPRLHHTPIRLAPDASRVVIRPFHLGPTGSARAARIVEAVTQMDSRTCQSELALVNRDFETRHWQTRAVYLERYRHIKAELGLNGRLREQQREAQIKLFDPREREAVEYLRWMKNQIYSNYKKFTGTKQIPHNIQSLDQRWEDFVDLLDVYRRRKHHLRSINRQAVQCGHEEPGPLGSAAAAAAAAAAPSRTLGRLFTGDRTAAGAADLLSGL